MTKQNMRRLRIPGQDNYVNNKIHKHPNLQLNLHISKRIFFVSETRRGPSLAARFEAGFGAGPPSRGGSGGWIRGWPPEQGGLEAGFGAGPPNKGVWRLDSGLAPRVGSGGLDSGLAPRTRGSGGLDSGLAPRTRGSGGWIRSWPPEQGGLEAGFGATPRTGGSWRWIRS